MRRWDPLEPVLDDVRAELAAQIAEGGRVRDFAAMIARARALDPRAVSEEDAAEAVGYAKVVALRRPAAVAAPAVAEAALDEGAAGHRAGRSRWIGAAGPGARRARWAGVAAAIVLGLGLAGAATLARRDATIFTGGAASHLSPAPGAETVRVDGPEGAPRARGSMTSGTGAKGQVLQDMSEGAVSSAAVEGAPAGDFVGVGDLPGFGAEGLGAASGASVSASAGDGAAASAGDGSGASAGDGSGTSAGDGAASAGGRAASATAGDEAASASESPTRGAPGGARESSPDADARAGGSREGSADDGAARPSTRPRLARADAGAGLTDASWEAVDLAARAAWRRGDLDQARGLLGVIVASAGDRERVELAYGDLLILARQAGDAAALQRARRDYLRRFPRGAFAEDASAGLCRDDDARECWRSYLDRWPQGAHADEARRALGE